MLICSIALLLAVSGMHASGTFPQVRANILWHNGGACLRIPVDVEGLLRKDAHDGQHSATAMLELGLPEPLHVGVGHVFSASRKEAWTPPRVKGAISSFNSTNGGLVNVAGKASMTRLQRHRDHGRSGLSSAVIPPNWSSKV